MGGGPAQLGAQHRADTLPPEKSQLTALPFLCHDLSPSPSSGTASCWGWRWPGPPGSTEGQESLCWTRICLVSLTAPRMGTETGRAFAAGDCQGRGAVCGHRSERHAEQVVPTQDQALNRPLGRRSDTGFGVTQTGCLTEESHFPYLQIRNKHRVVRGKHFTQY